MDNKTLHVVFWLLVGGVIIYLGFTNRDKLSDAPQFPVEYVAYMNPNNEFAVTHNVAFKAETIPPALNREWRSDANADGTLLVKITAPREYMPNTNFSGAEFRIGRSGMPEAITACTSGNGTDATVSGWPFKRFTRSEAAAGNLYETTSYRGILDGDCYVLEYTLHSTNLANYPEDSGISAFDKAKIEAEMEKIVRSFLFLVNSD